MGEDRDKVVPFGRLRSSHVWQGQLWVASDNAQFVRSCRAERFQTAGMPNDEHYLRLEFQKKPGTVKDLRQTIPVRLRASAREAPDLSTPSSYFNTTDRF